MSAQPSGTQVGAEAQPDPVETARVLLARAMLRGAAPIESVQFTAPCPACGRDCEWLEERIDTRLRAVVTCSCS